MLLQIKYVKGKKVLYKNCFTFPTVITEGKYGNQLEKIRKFRVVLSSGTHETGSTAKKVTASESAKPGPHIHILIFDSGVTGTCRNGAKREKVCMCVCDAFLLASISPRLKITFGSNLVWYLLYLGH